ncbi:hypothetical protein [Metabacillus sp. Hm71]|uniref:hypothetical protein n=1 Tax=Metabacillus sp. Hm71 TaxID=3450743 RepID=UPI003F440E38
MVLTQFVMTSVMTMTSIHMGHMAMVYLINLLRSFYFPYSILLKINFQILKYLKVTIKTILSNEFSNRNYVVKTFDVK